MSNALVSELRSNSELRVMERLKSASLPIKLLIIFTSARKNECSSGMEMRKENLEKSSKGEGRRGRKEVV